MKWVTSGSNPRGREKYGIKDAKVCESINTRPPWGGAQLGKDNARASPVLAGQRI